VATERQQAARNAVKFHSLDAADRAKIPHVAEFLALYPDATIAYLDFAGSEFPGLSLDALLHERYVLNLRLPVHYADGGTRIDRYGDPAFFLVEVDGVTARGGHLKETRLNACRPVGTWPQGAKPPLSNFPRDVTPSFRSTSSPEQPSAHP
jgi:hypothetical protein